MKFRSILVLTAAGALAGCQTPDVAEYQVSRDSLFLLQQLEPASVSLGAFDGPATIGAAASTELVAACSLSAEVEDGVPLSPAAYIRDALAAELAAAGLHADEVGDVQLSGQVSELSLRRGLPFRGEWTISLHLVSSNGSELQIRDEFAFDIGAFAGPTVCRRAVEHFEPAARALLEQAIRSPEFPSLLRGR